MGIQKITFDGANVTSKIDADLYHFLFSNEVGILFGLKNTVSYSLANNIVTFQDGYIGIYGRIIYIENGTQITITPDSVKNGFVVLGVNTEDNSVSLYLREQASGYPTLSKTNLVTSNGLCELALCAYTKTATSITLNASFTREIITSSKERTNFIEASIYANFKPVRVPVTTVTNGTYRFSGYDSNQLENALMLVVVNYNNIVSVPGTILFHESGSAASVNYRYGNSDYSLFITYNDSIVTLICGSTIQRVTSVIIFK